MSERIRVLVVDDSAYSRQTIKELLRDEPGIDVEEVAVDGADAIRKVRRCRPDVITLDLQMPGMDGFTFLRWLMQEMPTPVIMVSSRSDNETVFRALALGAVDFVAKPARRLGLEGVRKDLIAKIKGIDTRSVERLNRNLRMMAEGRRLTRAARCRRPSDGVVAIGASTGGPQALQFILGRMPPDFPAPIVVSQHMPEGFTGPLAERLNTLSPLKVKEAEDGEALLSGKVLISPGGHHLLLEKRGKVVCTRLRKAADNDIYTPSVDLMMSSVARLFRDNGVGVVLTGMGRDGATGMLEIQRAGGHTIAESEETAVVFGMPREAISRGAARKVLPLGEIPEELLRAVRGVSRGG